MSIHHAHDPQWRHDRGGDVITDTAIHSGRWAALQSLGCTLDAGTAAADITGALSGLVVPAGTTLDGRFTSVQLSAGAAVLYR